MTRVLLVGNGARENAIAWALVRGGGVTLDAIVSRPHPGISLLADRCHVHPITEPAEYPDVTGYDYAVIGPEAPLAAGVVDFLEERSVPCVGPTRAAAQIETSKVFARRLLARAAPSANPTFVVAEEEKDITDFIGEVGLSNVVVKPDGLTGGKGVKVFGEHLTSREEATEYALHLVNKDGRVILEEKLVGREFTVQCFVDGAHLVHMPLVRDYKRAYDNDVGPNTGSMGSYSQPDHMLDYVSSSDLEEALRIMRASTAELHRTTGERYRGILYGQFMRTESGVKVVEFNARFGDPEALNVLVLLDGPLDDVCRRIVEGNVSRPRFREEATVCVYVVPEGYPGPDVVKDSPLTFTTPTGEAPQPEVAWLRGGTGADGQPYHTHMFFASVYTDTEGRVRTTGSRSLAVVGLGGSVREARERAYADVGRVHGAVRFRTDIAAGV